MKRIKIAIDPDLLRIFGSEVCWTWRLLLSGMGFCWEQVPITDNDCDITYTSDTTRINGKFAVVANLHNWNNLSHVQLLKSGKYDKWVCPIFKGEKESPDLIKSENNRIVCHRDIIFDLFWLCTGQEEKYVPFNKHGFYDLSNTAFQREQFNRRAPASSIASFLQPLFLKLRFPVPIPQWPDGKKAAACIGHDVDYPQVIRWLEPLRILLRKNITGLSAATSILSGKRTHWHFSSWVNMERQFDVRSAFFFVAKRGSLLQYATGTPNPFYDIKSEPFRNIFQYLEDQGFEVGLHASYHAHKNRESFLNEKRKLEDISHQTIHGNRHHYWHLNPHDPESTLLLHEQVGFKYDASLTHERYLGWRRGLCWPFFPFSQKEKREIKTLQLQTAWMDDHLFSYQKDNPGDRLAILKALAQVASDQHGCLAMDVHDYVFDDLLFPRWASTYREFLHYLTSRNEFWIDTPKCIAKHWCERYQSIINLSHGLSGNGAGI